MISRKQRKLLLGSSMGVLVLLGQGPLAYAACVGQPSPVFLCSGTENVLQTIVATDADVLTDPDFNLDVGVGGALIISGDGNISFTDINAYGHRSNIKAHGYSALNISGGGGAVGSVTVNTDGTLYGGEYGISAFNQGGGILSITTGAGNVTGSLQAGISARDNGLGTGVSVTTGDGNIYSGKTGIKAKNFGTGELLVTTGNGTVTGATDFGIATLITATGTNTTIVTGDGDIFGRSTGIFAEHYGTGILSVTTGAGKVEGSTYYGIRSYSKGGGQVVTTGDGDVTGGQHGIRAINYGAGYLDIFTGAGKVTGTAGEGISAYGDIGTTAMSIATGPGAVTGGTSGIAAKNNGVGSLTVTTEGSVSGSTEFGISLLSANTSTDLTLTTGVGDVYGKKSGINVKSYGLGTLSITTGLGAITGKLENGIYAWHGGSNMTVTTGSGNVEGGQDGVRAINTGDGALVVTTGSGNVNGIGGRGIFAFGDIDSTSVTVNTGNGRVSGATYGISAESLGSGGLFVTSGNGDVQGGTDGILALNSGGSSMTIATGAGNVTGIMGYGINAFGKASGQSMTITTGNGEILGGDIGIIGVNFGSGALSITTGAGNVTGSTYSGIYALTRGAGVSVATGDGRILGGNFGIYGRNSGSSTLLIETGAGSVTGTNFDGILALGDIASNSLTVNTGDGAVSGARYGISAENSGVGGLFVTTANGEIDGGTTGISTINSGSGSMTLVTGHGKITGHAKFGVEAIGNSNGQSVTLSTGTGAISGGFTGITASNFGSGALSVASGAGKITGSVYSGIFAYTKGNGLSVLTGDGSVLGDNFGIYTKNLGSGALSIDTGKGSVTATDFDGIYALGDVASGSMNVTTGTGAISGGRNGIKTTNAGSSSMAITTGAGKITGTANNGIDAKGAATSTSLTVTTGLGDVTGGNNGISAENNGSGALTVTTGAGKVTGAQRFGIRADNRGTSLSVTTGNGVVSGVQTGVSTSNSGTGALIITTGKGAVTGNQRFGIDAFGGATSTSISIATGEGAVNGRNFGILAYNRGTGGIAVATGDGSVLGGNGGVVARNNGVGSIAVNTGAGSVTGQSDYGINAEAFAGAANLAITTGSGAVLGGKQGIRASQNGNGTFTISVGGLVSNLAKDMSGEAINASGKGVTLSTHSTGNITGRITTDRGAFDDVFNNSGLWISTGTSDFGGGTNHINNSGVVRVANSKGISETASFKNAGVFTNGPRSLLTLSDETPRNGSTTHDTLAIFGDFVGGGTLAVDAFLGGPGSTADVLTINGNITGKTALRVNNTNPLTGPANADGIAVVSYTGAAADDAYFLENGPLAVGLFSYDLAHDNTAKVFELIGSGVSIDGSGLATLVSASETIWHDTSGVLGDRLDELRGDESAAAVVDQAHIQPVSYNAAPNAGLWAKILGRTASRDVNAGLSYDMDTTGFIGGVDGTVNQSIIGGVLVLGATGGYVDANQNYKTGANANYEGFSGGIYATYANSGFHLDGELRANLLNLDYTTVGSPTSHSNVTSLGGSLDAGYRLEIGDNVYAEPLAHLAYVDTAIRDGDVRGVAFIGDGEGLKGALGLNLGGTFNGMENIVFKPKLSAKIWNEFKGDNTASFAGITVYDKLPETFGELGLNLEAVNETNGWSGQINGDIQFAKGFTSIGGFIGLGKNF